MKSDSGWKGPETDVCRFIKTETWPYKCLTQ